MHGPAACVPPTALAAPIHAPIHTWRACAVPLVQAKRAKGAPKAGKPGERVPVSIVVTDVQDFSELTRRYPELMNKALGRHNNIIRKACHAHAGAVLEQEVCSAARCAALHMCARHGTLPCWAAPLHVRRAR